MIHRNLLLYRGARYLWWALALVIGSAALYATQGDLQPPNGGTWQGYVLGTIGATLIAWLAMLGVRKRTYTSTAGAVQAWTSAHVYLGTALLVVATLHSGAQLGWNLHTLAYALLCAVIASGLFGLYAYLALPPLVSKNREGNAYRGTAFYDFNDNNLNALTYGQKLTGATRDDPNADTSVHRWGASFGGPIKSEKTFFYANYEGLRDTLITGGGRATVPTEAMRNGDFSGASFTIKDPKTGLPFHRNIIPASRIDPSATNIINFFYPLPNQGTLSNGWGIYQKYIPETRNRQRADLRIDHELSSKDSIFARCSYQIRDPRAFRSEVGSGNAFNNLPYLDDKLTTYSVIANLPRTRVATPPIWSKSDAREAFTVSKS